MDTAQSEQTQSQPLPQEETNTLAPQVQKPENGNGRKALLIAAVLVILIVVGMTAYYLGAKTHVQPVHDIPQTPSATPIVSHITPSPVAKITNSENPLKNWKTYTDSKYKYTFQYPPEWALSSIDDQNFQPQDYTAKHTAIFQLDQPDTSKPPLAFLIETDKPVNPTSLSQWKTLYAAGQGDDILKPQQTTIDGAQAIKLTKLPDTEDVIVVSPDNTLYAFVLYGNGGEGIQVPPYADNDPILLNARSQFNIVLTTFRFIR